MVAPDIFKLGRVSIIVENWHLAFKHFFAGKCWCSAESGLKEDLCEVGQLSMYK